MSTDLVTSMSDTFAAEPAPAPSRTFRGPASPPLWTKILSRGHVEVARLNDPAAAQTLMPADRRALYTRVRRLWLAAAIAAPLLGAAALAGARLGAAAYREHATQREAEVRIEVARKAEEARAAALSAKQRAEAEAREARERQAAEATATLARNFGAFVGGAGALDAARSFATVEMLTRSQAAAEELRRLLEGLVRGQTSQHVSQLSTLGPWSTPLVYRPLADHLHLVGVAIADGSSVKALPMIVGRMPGTDDVGIYVLDAGVLDLGAARAHLITSRPITLRVASLDGAVWQSGSGSERKQEALRDLVARALNGN